MYIIYGQTHFEIIGWHHGEANGGKWGQYDAHVGKQLRTDRKTVENCTHRPNEHLHMSMHDVLLADHERNI